jgi:hypothetical protein
MSNDFTKEEMVMWESVGADFVDNLKISDSVSELTVASQQMERAGDIVWEPQPFIAQTFDGMDQTENFSSLTGLAVPATISYEKSAPWQMNARESRDPKVVMKYGKAAQLKIASDINRAVMDAACSQGTLVVPVSTAAGDYDDVALCDSIMNETGVGANDRHLFLSSRDYNGMAGNLAVATRSFDGKKSNRAYEQGYVGEVAGFQTRKLDYANRIAAALGGGALTVNTQASAANYYTPLAKRVSATGERSNVDNRYQTITISSTTGVAAGDAFTIAGVLNANQITKQSTGELKTFRVISVPSSTTLVISPPIISNQGATDAEAQYQNCVLTESATAAIVFLNTTAANINPFWHKDAISLVPGTYAVESGSGMSVVTTTTPQGITLVFSKQAGINTLACKYRFDALFGVVNKQPEMSGILLFGQV